MQLSGIYAITENAVDSDLNLVQKVQQALEGGISLLQYRSKSADRDSKLRSAVALRQICADYQVPLIINDDVELCLAAGASGVHLGQRDGDIQQAVQALGPGHIVGVTCHDSIPVALKAQRQGATYVAFGRFYSSPTKPEAPPAPLAVLTAAKTKLAIPVVTIGGINAENGQAAIEAGADMLAVISYLFSADDIQQRAQRLSELFK